MVRRWYVLGLCAWVWAGPGWASAQADTQAKADSIRVVQLTLHPAPEPEYALQYRFDTPYIDQRPGNGALLYETAVSLLGQIGEDWQEVQEKVDQWNKADPATLPMDEVRKTIARFEPAIHYLDLAGRCEECTWNFPIREEGLRCILPNLTGYRTLLRVLSLKTRVAMADGAIPDAIETLRIGLSMARDMGKGPTMIQALVGVGMASRMFEEVERLVQRPDAPNLYWALTSLPRPLVDMRRALEMERAMIYAELPQLRTIETRAFSEGELADIWKRMLSIGSDGELGAAAAAAAVAGAMRIYPEAKADLERRGKGRKEIEAMPVSQVLLIYQVHRFRRLVDAAAKWNYVPYWQAGDRYRQVEETFFSGELVDKEGPAGWAFWAMFPNLRGVGFLQTRLERDIAMLRCVEALRIYAAGHQGRLPQSLDEVTEVPIPIDPLRGHGFQYRLTGDKAVLESPPPAGHEERRGGVRYEILIRPVADRDAASR